MIQISIVLFLALFLLLCLEQALSIFWNRYWYYWYEVPENDTSDLLVLAFVLTVLTQSVVLIVNYW